MDSNLASDAFVNKWFKVLPDHDSFPLVSFSKNIKITIPAIILGIFVIGFFSYPYFVSPLDFTQTSMEAKEARFDPIKENQTFEDFGEPTIISREFMESLEIPFRSTPILSEKPIPSSVPSNPNVKNPPPTKQSILELRQIAFEDINKFRVENGLDALSLGNASAPQLHAEALLQEGCISHVSKNGDGPITRYLKAGDEHLMVFENIAGSYGNSLVDPIESMLYGNYRMMFKDEEWNWDHRDNILNPKHESVSIGISYDERRLVLIEDFEQSMTKKYQKAWKKFDNNYLKDRFCW